MPILSFGSLTHDIGFEGQLASGQRFVNRVGTFSELFNGSSVFLPFGRFVVANGALGDVRLPSATGQTVIGVTEFVHKYEKDLDLNSGIPPMREVTLIKRGIIYMLAETALVANTNPFVRHTANPAPASFEGIGRIRNNADTAKADLFTGARVLRTVVAGEIVPVELFID